MKPTNNTKTDEPQSLSTAGLGEAKTWPMPEYKELSNNKKHDLYEAFGPSCNVCKNWYTDGKEEPCASCTGGITDTGDYSNFELHDALRPNV